jgi:hypothetical protein
VNKLSKSALAAACAGLVVSACSSSGSTGASGSGANNVSTQGVLAGAYQKVLDVHSADLAADITVTTATGTSEHITLGGAMQWQPLLGELSISVPIGHSSPVTLGYRLVGGNMYIQVPQALAGQTGGKTWIEGSLSSLVGSGAETSFDPSAAMGLLASQSDSVTKVGTGTVNGVAATEYTAQLDLNKTASSSFLQGGALRQLLPALKQMAGSSTFPVEVWVDNEGRLVKYQMSLTLEHPPTASSASTADSAVSAAFPIHETIIETMSDYGVAVHVSAPPASQTMPVDLGGLLGSSGI